MEPIQVISSAQAGDLDAFNQLALASQDKLFNIAARILGDDQMAADAVQEALLSAFCNLHQYRGGSFISWLIRMVINASYDLIRYQRRRPTTPLDGFERDDMDCESLPWQADPSCGPEAQCEQAELNDEILRAMRLLPASFRAVLVLSDIQGMDYAEVACVLGVPVGTVKSRLARARLRLRRSLHSYLYSPGTSAQEIRFPAPERWLGACPA
jgi:RNA polymerase sigma-70 factor (ECF subfamily)